MGDVSGCPVQREASGAVAGRASSARQRPHCGIVCWQDLCLGLAAHPAYSRAPFASVHPIRKAVDNRWRAWVDTHTTVVHGSC